MAKILWAPLIKETHLKEKLVAALGCFDKNPHNRRDQEKCVLSLYKEKSAKSVFRGMVIPSLRDLGWIIGYDTSIRVSANGKILLEASKKEDEGWFGVLRILLLEIDQDKYCFLSKIKPRQKKNKEKFINNLSKVIAGPSEKQRIERVNKWLGILDESKFISIKDKYLSLNENVYMKAKKEVDTIPDLAKFKLILFKKYREFPLLETAGVVDIARLREAVALEYYKKGEILSEAKFDMSLKKTPLATDKYIISLGQAMGNEEKLFILGNRRYRTISISFQRS